jgi:hypothetical protein
MSKQAVSVTLEHENLVWLRGQTRGAGGPSLSAVLDRLVSAARAGGHVHEATIRSVVGSIRISEDDPQLLDADNAVRKLFPQPLVAEGAASYRRSKKRSRPQRRGTGR